VSVRVIISVRKLSHPHGTILPAMLFDVPFRSPTLLYDCNVTQSPRRESRAERTHAFIQIPRARQSSNRPAFSKAQQWIFGSGKRVLVLLVLIISSWCNWLLISQRDRLFEARLATIIFFSFRNQRLIQSILLTPKGGRMNSEATRNWSGTKLFLWSTHLLESKDDFVRKVNAKYLVCDGE